MTIPKWEYSRIWACVVGPDYKDGRREFIVFDVSEAHGPLIAAAPEMLEILRELTIRQVQDYPLFMRAVAVCSALKDWPGGKP